MNNKSKLFSVFFVVFLIVSITPAFAIQMEQVAKDAENYDIESKHKKGFFAKIKFMAKGFKLINKAKSAEKNSNKDTNKNSEGNYYKSMWNKNQQKQKNTQELLQFRNSKRILQQKPVISDIKQHQTTQHNTKQNETNKNKTKDDKPKENGTIKNKTINILGNIPEACFTDANHIIEQLKTNKITLTLAQTEIKDALIGNIVQIIDEKGHIHYLYVKSLSETSITLTTTDNKEIILNIDEFKKEYTGIVLLIKHLQIPEPIITQINQIQKDEITTDLANAELNKKRAKSDIILDSILTGVGLLLFVIGALLAVIFAKLIAANSTQTVTCGMQKYTVDVIADGLIGSVEDRMTSEMTPWTIAQEELNIGFNPRDLVLQGLILTAVSTFEIICNTASNNWIRVILGVVGLILILVGIGLMVYNIIALVFDIANFTAAKTVLKSLKENNEDMNEWLKKGEVINQIDKPFNNNTNLNKTHLIMNKTNSVFKI